ncbi:MAG TPA: hypothetical protein VHC90_11365 [Bryobacteraceae bacterium]|nr:hypothetical protein [Bryobacteraceae bacterium]
MKKTTNALEIAGNHIAEADTPMLNLGISIGIAQALHVVRAITEVGQAREIKKLKESGAYKRTGLDWKKFCAIQLGMSHTTADAAIANLNTLGENYFAVNKFVPISPGTFGLIEGKIDSEGMEIDGEKVAFTTANAPRIKRAIETLRKQARDAKAEADDAENKAKIATAERDNAKKGAAEARRKLAEAMNPTAFADADEDHKTMLNVQSRVDAALVMLGRLKGRTVSDDNQRRYVGLVKYLHCELLRAIDEAMVPYATLFDPHDPSGALWLDSQADQGTNLVEEHVITGGRK